MKITASSEFCNPQRVTQMDLFPETIPAPAEPPPSASPLFGLKVRIERKDAAGNCDVTCQCGSRIATLGSSAGPHEARITCDNCGTHRGWISREAANGILELIEHFGVPDTPIVFRRKGG
jgi:hypothetical protein